MSVRTMKCTTKRYTNEAKLIKMMCCNEFGSWTKILSFYSTHEGAKYITEPSNRPPWSIEYFLGGNHF